ncbi:MAG: autotransporter domain-containing protein [Rhodothermaceae bacterium]|nr:autotransporter domain-containing protein [Rhodothermaceae bacterium]
MKIFLTVTRFQSLPSQYIYGLTAFILLLAGTTTTLYAQSPCEEALRLATEEYDQGYFERATFRLTTCIDSQGLNEVQEKEAYLLLGKIYYANLQIEDAKKSVRMLLSKNPAYELNPEEHKPGFIDLYKEVMLEIVDTKQIITSRNGFWIGFGVGPAEGNIQCGCPLGVNLPDNDPWNGGGSSGSFTLALGGTPNPNLQLGAELSQWQRSVDIDGEKSTSTIGMLSFIAKYYPNATGNFFLKGGVGVGTSTLEREVGARDNTFKLEGSGMGMQFGLGFDILLGKQQKTALTPYINLSVVYAEEDVQILQFQNAAGQLDALRFSGPENPSFFQLGLAFTLL